MDSQAFGADGGYPEAAGLPPGPRRSPGRVIAAVLVPLLALAVFGIAFALSGGAPAYDAGAKPGSGAASSDVAARAVWRSASADQILPPQIDREGTEAYYRLGVDANESCAQLPSTFVKVLGAAGCAHVIQATYLDSTETVVATVGLVAVGGTTAQRSALFQSWTADAYARQYSMMPSTYPVPVTLASSFGNAQRVAWKSSISNDGSYIAFAVSGFADGRLGPSASVFDLGNASELQSSSPPVQVADDLSDSIMTGFDTLSSGNGAQS
ncbi:MAG TPA: hypothetical protein VL551_07630 [Actinospica sp.]|nr:hypothetical protein [Actinospica sp.]